MTKNWTVGELIKALQKFDPEQIVTEDKVNLFKVLETKETKEETHGIVYYDCPINYERKNKVSTYIRTI